MSVAEIILLGPGEGNTVSLLGGSYTFKAAAKDNGSAYGLFEFDGACRFGGPASACP